MNVGKWVGKFADWAQRKLRRKSKPRKVYTIAIAPDVEKDRLPADVLVIERRAGKDRWVHFRCPCPCQETISLNLMTSQMPFWSLIWHADGTVSVTPSVDKTSGCRSHFFIRRCRIEWAPTLITS